MYSKQQNPKHEKGAEKTARIPIKVETTTKILRKPDWIRVRAGTAINSVRKLLREQGLNTVCEDASCPNMGECFSHGTATFMIMGDICTRRCPFCDVAHGKPDPLDLNEPAKIADAVDALGLSYVVITSVDRDDLKDGGSAHFVSCIKAIDALNKAIKIEILVPDFRGRMEIALKTLSATPLHVFNHNLETIPRLYKSCRPGADYKWSLTLLQKFKANNPSITTKSGLMLGLGESHDEIIEVLHDMRAHDIEMLTLGQYLQPSKHHLPVQKYWHPDEFDALKTTAEALGFASVASAPMVRSSYHADLQATAKNIIPPK